MLFLRDFSGLESFNSLLPNNPDKVLTTPTRLTCMFGPLKHDDSETRFFGTHQCGHLTYNYLRILLNRAKSIFGRQGVKIPSHESIAMV